MVELVSNYSFKPDDLNIADRKTGISAFMRIRNGADFLEPTIRSHIDHFDEIVAVYNQCTDNTPDILAQLAQEYGARLRVFHYTDRVFPPGSEGHANTAPHSPNSLVNYYNFALAQTRFKTVTKLDDDHIAIKNELVRLTCEIREAGGAKDKMLGFSGMNLWRDNNGELSICSGDSISGGGDIGFFDVRNDRFFTHDKRFERGPRAGLTRIFSGILYWHLKYLKPEFGFSNYELNTNPNSRYIGRKSKIEKLQSGEALSKVCMRLQPSIGEKFSGLLIGKQRFLNARNARIREFFDDLSAAEAVSKTVEKPFQNAIFKSAN